MQSQIEETTGSEVLQVLVIEDNPSDVYLIRSALACCGLTMNITVLTDGEKATHFFDEVDQNPAIKPPQLVILDLNLPRKHGTEVLEHMRLSSRSQKASVIVISSSDLQWEQEKVSKLGADAYFRKPSEFAEFLKLGDVVRQLFPRGHNEQE